MKNSKFSLDFSNLLMLIVLGVLLFLALSFVVPMFKIDWRAGFIPIIAIIFIVGIGYTVLCDD